MNGKVQFAKFLATLGNHVFEATFFGHIQLEEKLGAKGFGQRLGVLGGLFVLVGDGNIGTQGADRLGHREGD